MAFKFRVRIEGVCHGAARAVNFEVFFFFFSKQILPGHLSFIQFLLGLAEGVMEISNRSQNLKASSHWKSRETRVKWQGGWSEAEVKSLSELDKGGNKSAFNEKELHTGKCPVKSYPNPCIVSSSGPWLFLCLKYCYFLGAHLPHKKDYFNGIKAKPDHGLWRRMGLTILCNFSSLGKPHCQLLFS